MALAVQAGDADTVLKAIQAAIPKSILQHLPTDQIRLDAFEDKRHERPIAMSVRMLFGHIKGGKEKDLTVWILLQKGNDTDRSPDHRFNIFDRIGNIQKQISADDAVRQTNAVSAFKCLKTSGVIDMDQLRTVIKYYFIISRVKTPSPFLVNPQFMSSLTAACKVAKGNQAKVVLTREMGNGRDPAVQDVYALKPSVSKPRVISDNGVSVKVEENLAIATPSVTKTRRTPQPLKRQRAPTTPMVPLAQSSSDLFIPEDPHVEAASDTSINKARNFLTQSDSDDRDDTSATKDISGPASEHPKPIEVLSERGPNLLLPDNFVSTYRRIINDRDAIKDEIKANKKRQKVFKEGMQTRRLEQERIEQAAREEEDAKAAQLEEEQQKLKEELRLNGPAKKRLRESLSDKDRALFLLGAEIATRQWKRARTQTQSEEDTSS